MKSEVIPKCDCSPIATASFYLCFQVTAVAATAVAWSVLLVNCTT